MKKLLKITALIMCLVLVVLAISGCGKKDTNEIEEGTILQQEETATTTGNKENEKVFERGKWTGNVYTSEFANITFKLPEGWTRSTDEEIAEMMNVGVDALNDDQQSMAKLAEQTSVYDMIATNSSTGASVMIMFEKTLVNVSIDYYVDKIKTGLKDVEVLDYSIGDVTTETLAGEEYTVLTTTVPTYNMIQKYYIKQEGKYFIDVLFTYIEGKDNLDNLTSCFQ